MLMICPFPASRMDAKAALFTLTVPKKIHLKLCLCLIKRSELHRARDAEASTVDYNIELPCFRKNLSYCLLNRIFIGHIHADVFYSVLRYISAAEFIDCKPSIFSVPRPYCVRCRNCLPLQELFSLLFSIFFFILRQCHHKQFSDMLFSLPYYPFLFPSQSIWHPSKYTV